MRIPPTPVQDESAVHAGGLVAARHDADHDAADDGGRRRAYCSGIACAYVNVAGPGARQGRSSIDASEQRYLDS